MRLATFSHRGQPCLGMVREGGIVHVPGLSMLELIAGGEKRLQNLDSASAPVLPFRPEELLAPIPVPRRNVIAVGLNYADHVKESSEARGKTSKLPEHPVFFTKAPNTVNGPYAPIPFDPAVTSQLDWEVELGVILGRRGKNIPADRAMEYVFGYTVINDVSARDLQSRHGQFFKGKSLDGACPMGPWIATADEIPDPHNLTLRCQVNGVVKQEASTDRMIFRIPALIEALSRGMKLEPGEIISTGTPSGVGMGCIPPEYLRPGDVVECEVEGIGRIRNRVGAGE